MEAFESVRVIQQDDININISLLQWHPSLWGLNLIRQFCHKYADCFLTVARKQHWPQPKQRNSYLSLIFKLRWCWGGWWGYIEECYSIVSLDFTLTNKSSSWCRVKMEIDVIKKKISVLQIGLKSESFSSDKNVCREIYSQSGLFKAFEGF